MKSAVIALFLGATSAVKLNDAPPYFNEPTWNERMPSAGGFLMVSACVNSGVAGVTCSPPNSQLFATGMNGDEDLGEDIIMKGTPFHYNQGKPASLLQLSSKWVELPDCGYGTLGADEVPLASDLSNAIIATCKGYDPLKQAPERFPE